MNRALARNTFGAVIVLALAGSCAVPQREAIAPREAAAVRAAFDPAEVERGAELVAIGDCRTCHTAPGGEAFAGGLPLETSFGTIYSTNITPDPRTGIGRWSEAAFRRAMREGVDRSGRNLYPAFPYDRFTLATDEDDRAIYAYLMTRRAVRHEAPPDRVSFPFNLRPLIGMWKALYFRPGPYRPDPSHDAQWNRGAYLAEGLGHCSSCHTPRNALGAEIASRHFDGGEAEGWHAYAIGARSQSPTAWDVESMREYLRRGWQPRHGVARGPMAPVTRELAHASDADVRAIAAYVVSPMRGTQESQAPARPAVDRAASAAQLYEGACALCHEGRDPLPFGGIALGRSIGVSGESPRNLVNVILYGLPAANGATAPMMPGYAGAMNDAQVAELARYLRARLTGKPAWSGLEGVVREARAAGPRIAMQPAGGTGTDPARIPEAR